VIRFRHVIQYFTNPVIYFVPLASPFCMFLR